jgi:hypothetical protein
MFRRTLAAIHSDEGDIDAAGQYFPRLHRARRGRNPRVHPVTLRATFFDANGEDRDLDQRRAAAEAR